MQRFFIENFSAEKNVSIQDSRIIHQCYKVLRYKAWDLVIFFDGKNLRDYIYEIQSLDKRNFLCVFKKTITKQSRNKNIILHQAQLNNIWKYELIVQKCVEIGVKKIIFFQSQRSQKIFLSDAKKRRLQTIAIEAMEQSYNNTLVNIIFSEKILDSNWEMWYFLDTTNDSANKKNIKSLNWTSENIHIFIWPEWWFNNTELAQMKEYGYKARNFWESILRSETAAIVSCFYFLHN